jgi:hypothetical protein
VDYRASAKPRVTLTVEGVRISTAIAALSDETNLKIGIAAGKLVVTD